MYLAFILTFFYSWFLIVCLNACVLLSVLFLFFLYSSLYVHVYITLRLFYTLSFLFYFNFFVILCDIYSSEMLCVVLISINSYFLHFYCYFYILNHISCIQQTINLQTQNMNPNQWIRLRVSWIKCRIMTSGGTLIATMISPIYENKHVTILSRLFPAKEDSVPDVENYIKYSYYVF
mgnify:CR=1 FL=1